MALATVGEAVGAGTVATGGSGTAQGGAAGLSFSAGSPASRFTPTVLASLTGTETGGGVVAGTAGVTWVAGEETGGGVLAGTGVT